MNIRQLKKKIADLPDDMEVVLTEYEMPGEFMFRVHNLYVTKARLADEYDKQAKDVVVFEMNPLRLVGYVLA